MFEKQYECLKLLEEGGIGQVILSSAPVNAITPQFMDDLEAAFIELREMPQLRAVVISSGIKKVFVAGADIKAFQYMDGEGTMAISRRGNAVYQMIEDFPVPVICAVNGMAFGGGLELALACDIRVFDEKAKAGLPEASLGIVPGYGGSQRLPRIVGEAEAKRLLFTAAALNAEEAYRIGLAQKVSAVGESVQEALKMAEAICRNAPLAVAAAKRCIHAARGEDFQAGVDYETAQGGLLFETEDKLEGMSAFVEKRTPDFKKK